jgi:hypothetical protein
MSFSRRLSFIIAFVCPLFLLHAQGPAPAPPLDNPQTEQHINKLLGEMTLVSEIDTNVEGSPA